MADGNGHEPEQERILTTEEFEELVAATEVAALQAHGYLTSEGERDEDAIEQKLLARVLSAEATSRGQREVVAVTRAELMREMFPALPGPGQFDEQDHPQVATTVYGRLNKALWAKLSDHSTGPIQSRLNGEHSLVLCRTQATPDGQSGVYVTRNRECLRADFTAPASATISRAVRRMGRDVAMAAERVPEHGPWLLRQLLSGTRTSLSHAEADVTAMIEAASSVPSDE